MRLYIYKIRSIKQVRDGDTFVCDIDLGFGLTKQVVVRLLDFDACETRRTHKAKSQAKQCGLTLDDVIELGKQLKDYLEKLLTQNADNLVLESHEVDSFGRSLGTVWVGEDTAINELMRQYQLRLLERYRDKAKD